MVDINGIIVRETLPANCVDIHDACICTLDSCIEDDELNVPNAVDYVTKAGVIWVPGNSEDITANVLFPKKVHWGLVDEQVDTVIVDAPKVTADIIAALLNAGLIHAE